MAERVLGLDVGTSAVRVVEVASDTSRGRGRQPGRQLVTRVGEVPLPPGAVRDGEVVDPAAVGAAIRELWRQTGLRSRDVRVGMAGSRMVVRVVDMPAMPDDELDGAIRFSAADHIPIPLDEAVLDHAVLEPAPPAEPGGPPQVRVLVAAAYRSALDGLLAAVTAGGLRAVAVDLVPFALVRALAEPADETFEAPAETEDGFVPPPAPVSAEAIVSVGAALTTVVVHEAGRPRFVRTVQAGGDMLTAAISDELGVEIDAAEAAKRDPDGDEDLGARGCPGRGAAPRRHPRRDPERPGLLDGPGRAAALAHRADRWRRPGGRPRRPAGPPRRRPGRVGRRCRASRPPRRRPAPATGPTTPWRPGWPSVPPPATGRSTCARRSSGRSASPGTWPAGWPSPPRSWRCSSAG